MPTINSYLTTMQSNLYVNGTERESIKKSIDAIYDRLGWYFGTGKNNPHKIIKKEIFGSYSRDTMLSRKYDNNSDIDLMIIFEDSKDYNPQTCLNWLKNFAEYWYPNSLVKQSLPTVVIELQNIKFELVPAYVDQYNMIYIAKNGTSWQYTNPKDLNQKMNDLNSKTNFEFKRMVRLIKYWNVQKNNGRYQSYSLEKYLMEKFETSYTYCNNQYDYLDWAFYYLKNWFGENDEYITPRIQAAINNLLLAKNCEEKYDYETAVNYIKRVIPEF